MTTKGTRVYITVKNTGEAYGTRGQCRSAATGRVLCEAPVVRPCGNTHAAEQDARDFAAERGYVVVPEEAR